MSELWALTGSSGYLGRALRENLLAGGMRVRGLARSGADINADVRDAAAMRRLIADAAVVVHLAAYVHRAARGKTASQECWSVNVGGTDTLIEALRDGPSRPFAILVSSASVYGPSATALDESAPCRPRTPYGRAKLEAERHFLEAVGAGEIRGCVLRPAMIFGPGAPGNLQRLSRMIRSGFVVEVARGVQRKSLVPIADAVGAIRAVAACQEACNNRVFNLAGETLTVHEIITILSHQRSKLPRVISLPRGLVRCAVSVASLVAPPLAALAETYGSETVIVGAELARVTGFSPSENVRGKLAAAAVRLGRHQGSRTLPR